MLEFEQAEENLTRRYKRVDTIQRIHYIKNLRAEGKTVPQIKDIPNQTKWA